MKAQLKFIKTLFLKHVGSEQAADISCFGENLGRNIIKPEKNSEIGKNNHPEVSHMGAE